MKTALPRLLLFSLILASAVTVGAQERIALPDLGGTSTRVLPAELEQTFARDFERYFRAHNLLIEDPLIRDFFTDMGFALVAHSDRPSAPFHFHVLRDPNINAFATLAGVIGLNAGLILMAHDQSEVAGVVAHEIAHVTQDHIARSIENQQQVSMPTMLATLGLALAAAAAGSGDASQAILLSGMGLATQFQINHTRQAEAEADRVGIALLGRAGFDPHGMTRFFERLNVHSRAMGAGPPEYLRSHPLTVNRVAEARSRAESVNRREHRDDREFHYVQARLRVLMTQHQDQAIEYFRTRLSRDDRPADAMRYGLVLALTRARRLDEAGAELALLRNAQPERQLYRLLEAEWLVASGQTEVAIESLAELYSQFPGNRMIASQYAEALMHEHDPDRAMRAAQVARRYLRSHPNNLQMTELLARAADRAGEPVRAAEAVADSYYLRGGVSEAIEQLERVSRRDDLDFYQRSRISARLTELRSEQIRMAARGRP